MSTTTEIAIYLNPLNMGHRRTDNFRPGGAVDHLPKKFLQVAQIFKKRSKRNEGYTMQQHRSCSFSGSIPTKFEHKLRHHK